MDLGILERKGTEKTTYHVYPDARAKNAGDEERYLGKVPDGVFEDGQTFSSYTELTGALEKEKFNLLLTEIVLDDLEQNANNGKKL